MLDYEILLTARTFFVQENSKLGKKNIQEKLHTRFYIILLLLLLLYEMLIY